MNPLNKPRGFETARRRRPDICAETVGFPLRARHRRKELATEL